MLAKICFCSGFVGARAGASTAAAKFSSKADKEDQPTGPEQKGRGVPGQYVYWITFPHPTDSWIQRLGLRTPAEFDRDSFSELVVKVHHECDVTVVETANFQEPHASGKPHLNCLGRSSSQYR